MNIIKKNKYRLLSTISKYSFVVIILFTLILPIVVVKASDVGTTNTARTGDVGTTHTVNTEIGIKNPLPGIDDIPSFIVAIIKIVLLIGVPIITLAIIYSGFLFVQAQGNPEKITKAKQALIYTIVGAAILLGAFVITEAIQGTVDAINDENV